MAQEKKTAVDVTAGGGGLLGSPSPAKRGSGSNHPLSPPPRTPESRISTAAAQSPPGGMVDRRQLFEGQGGSSSGDATAMPPPPTTPKSTARRPRSQSKTPAKRGTPKDVTVMRQGVVGGGAGGGSSSGSGGKEEPGEGEDGGQGDGDGGGEGGSATPRKKKKAADADGTVRTLSMTPTKKGGDAVPETPPRSAGKKGAFGRTVDGSPMRENVVLPPEVKRVYSLVNKATGAIGGNGSAGAIYGELTAGGMQKVVNVLKEEAGFDENSSFIDVGSGLGKPNFHVAQDPGVEISYGLELEEVRWELSISNHRTVLKDEGRGHVNVSKHNLFFAVGDILRCKTFDPFTHVYMFDIGFPPATLREIAKKFNNSQARHLVSYQIPKKVTEEYAFRVDYVRKLGLHLTGSKEGKTMYLYRRKGVAAGLKVERITEVDPFFEEGVKLCREGRQDGSDLAAHVEAAFQKNTSGGVKTRRSRRAASP